MANSVAAAGNASITINEKETEARLVFVPVPGGQEWDAAAINKLASEKQLGAFPDPKALETFLAKAAKAKPDEKMEIIFSRGIEPEEPVGEKIKWEALPVPGDMAPFQAETLRKAGAPEIIQVKVERIKHEKTVKKSGALPFIAGKEEIAVTWEKKETREKVNVDPAPRELKYADSGAKLGTITPPVPGKPGKNVFGQPIAPSSPEEGGFLLGNGIVREKNEFRALVSGFVRIGENWADIVPMSKHSWKIVPALDGVTFFLAFEPGDSRFSPPRGEEILAAAAAKGAAEHAMLRAEEIDEAVAESVKTGAPLEGFSLFRVQEALAAVEINDDKTKAVLSLRKGIAGALPLEMKAISRAIKESAVRGFDTEKLKTDIHEFMQGKELELKDYVLVEGKASTRGKDREVKNTAALLSAEEQQAVRLRLCEWISRGGLEEKELDPEKASGFAFVEKGAPVAKVTPPSEGEAGKDVFGNDIPGFPGNDPDIKLFQGLELRGNDIAALMSGLLVLDASDKSYRGKIFEYKDAKIGIRLSEDNMEARADLFREEGAGIPLSIENVRKVLAILGIKKGIDWEEVENACAAARRFGSVQGRVIARGEAPAAKGVPALKWLLHSGPPEIFSEPEEVPAAGDSSLPLPGTEAGDALPAFPPVHASEGKGVQVKAGDPIALLEEGDASGRPGYDVKGNEISVEKALPSIGYDDSIREELSEAGKRLVASRSGELRFNGKALSIFSTKIIEGDLGPAAGDVKFSGEIEIGGNVLPGSRIMGGSNVVVKGLAEAAFIFAGGRAVTARGFKGDDRGVIRARTGIESAFVERALVMAIGDIQLNRGSIRSSIKTNGKLLVSGEAGKLSGGVCQARQGIDAADIGSEKGLRTEISFGQDYLLKDAINACEDEISSVRQRISALDEKLKICLEKKQTLPEELKREKIKFVKFCKQLELRLFTLREKFEEHFESEIRIRGTVFPGVVIESHNRYYEVKQKRRGVFFYFDRESGRIKEKPIN